MYPAPHISTLANGAKLVTINQQESSAVTILVLMRVGSRYESDAQRGLAHFTEHMVFKGGKQYPTAQDIARTMDGIGGEFNAFTAHELTGFYTKTASRHAEIGMSVLGDMLLHATFPADELEKEKGVIVEEINMYEDMPMRKVDDVLSALLFGDTPMGRPVLGEKETVRAFTAEDFRAYREQFYHGDACVIVCAGAIDPEEARRLTEKYMGELPSGAWKDAAPATVTEERLAHLVRPSEQTHFMIAFPGVEQTSEERFIQRVATTILGGSMSSRMFERVREQQGLCYYVRTYADTAQDVGFVVTNAGVDNERVELAIESVVHELQLFAESGPTEEEMVRAKEYLLGKQLLGLETSDALGEFYGIQQLLDAEILTPEQIAERIQAVTQEQVAAYAKNYIRSEKLRLALVGPERKTDLVTLLG